MATNVSDRKRTGAGAQLAESPAAPQAPETPESLDKVRDILFGGQMRAVETRIHSLEERLLREQQALRADFARQVGDLEAFARKELTDLLERLAAERAKRNEELKALGSELKEAIRGIEKRHVKLEEAAHQADATLRDQLLLQAKATSTDLGKLSDRLSAELTRSHQELKATKTDSAALATLFSDLASRLGGGPEKNGRRG
jgi:chromosome segregation ATPase